jgi:hypothetical protein
MVAVVVAGQRLIPFSGSMTMLFVALLASLRPSSDRGSSSRRKISVSGINSPCCNERRRSDHASVRSISCSGGVRPSGLPQGDSQQRQLLLRAGRAEHLAAQKKFDEALREYERLTADFPSVKNVQYALGRYFVATREPEKAEAAFEREIAISPEHVPARLGIAAIKAQTDPAAALQYAEAAVKLNPRIPLGHYLLGSLLLHTPQTARAIAELETAERSVRDDPGVYYALGRAYARAGRPENAARARATFKRLTEERQQAARRSATGEGPPK